MNNQNLPHHVQELYDYGERCMQRMLVILHEWPIGEYSRRIDPSVRPAEIRKSIRKLIRDLEQWVEALANERAVHDHIKLAQLFDLAKGALTKEEYYKDTAIEDAEVAKRDLLLLVETMPIVNRLEAELCSCASKQKPVVRRYKSRPLPRAYRQLNPKFRKQL